MKISFIPKYGSAHVLQIKEIEKPTPKPDEVLIKVYASAVTRADTMMRSGTPKFGRLFLGLKRPKNPYSGTGFSGVIEAMGNEVKNFKVGQAVFGESGLTFSANAEFLCVSSQGVIAEKPISLSHPQAACICDGVLTSYAFLKDLVQIKPNQKLLINGASGSLGSAAIQIAKILGAHVTGVCSSKNQDWVKSLGADDVIDYTQTDFCQNTNQFDFIYDSVGLSTFSNSQKALKPNGTYLSPVLSLGLLGQVLKTKILGSKKAIFSATGLRPAPELIQLLKELTPHLNQKRIEIKVSQTFNLSQITEAHSHVDSCHKQGNVVIDNQKGDKD